MHGIDKDSWYTHGHIVLTRTPSIDKDSWYLQGNMVKPKTHGIDKLMVLTETHGIEWVLLNHTRTRGPSVTRMRDFLLKY